jgi:endonuclease-3
MKTRAEASRILRGLAKQHPNADTELHYRTAFELLVATVLSAQTTDVGVNAVTPALFARFPHARALAAADAAEVESLVKSTGFFRQKARSIIGLSQALVDAHDGDVPPDLEALVKLPGVGRKTANVVLAHALGIPGLPVDRHVLRVSNRIGLAQSDDPEAAEQQLGVLYPPADWRLVSDTLILHGRRICNPKPLCGRCSVRRQCDAYRSGAVTPADTPTGPREAATKPPGAGRASTPARRPRPRTAASTRPTAAAARKSRKRR